MRKTIWMFIIPLENWLNFDPFSSNDQTSIIHHLTRKHKDFFWGSELIAFGVWKGYIFKTGLENVEKLDASDVFCLRKINVKELLMIHVPNNRWSIDIKRKRLKFKSKERKSWLQEYFRNSRMLNPHLLSTTTVFIQNMLSTTSV